MINNVIRCRSSDSHLKANGVRFNCEPWTMPSGTSVAFVVAPDEVSVEIIQRPKG